MTGLRCKPTRERPLSVAVIGASNNPFSIGNIVIRNLAAHKFRGPIFPINPKSPHIRSFKAFKSVLEVPDVVKARQRPTTMPNALTFEAVYDKGIRSPNMVLGPKIPKANEYHEIVRVGTQQCISGELSAQEACESIRDELNSIHDV